MSQNPFWVLSAFIFIKTECSKPTYVLHVCYNNHMKIMVISDTHYNINRAVAVIRKQKPDIIFHLGDMVSDAEDLSCLFPDITIHCVKGNNDFFSKALPDLLLSLDGVNYYLTHGHAFGVKSGIQRLVERGKRLGADFILFGHTHQIFDQTIGNVRVMNPSNHGYIIIENNLAEVRKY